MEDGGSDAKNLEFPEHERMAAYFGSIDNSWHGGFEVIQAGLASVTLRSRSPDEIINLCAVAGLSAIEWGSDVHVPVGELTVAKRVGDHTRDAGLTVASYGSYFRAEEDSGFEAVADTAVSLGACNIRVWAGKLGSSDSDESARQRVAQNLRWACEIASQGGLTVSAEFHGGTLTDTLDSALILAREVSLPNFKLYWQPTPERSHAERLGELARMIPLLSNIHVFQWTQEGELIKRHPLAVGAYEWVDYLRAATGNRLALLEFIPEESPQMLIQESKTLLGFLKQLE